MRDVTEGGRSRRRRSRLDLVRSRTAVAIASAGGSYADLKAAIVNAITSAFGDIMLNMTLNNMLDGRLLNQQLSKYQLRKVSIFT